MARRTSLLMCSLLQLIGASLLSVDALPASVCGPEQPSKVQDCDKPDLGSCGTACCSVELHAPKDADAVYEALKRLLQSGLDGQYTYVTGSGKPNPADDLRPYNITKPAHFEFVLQGTHATLKYKGANSDVLNFNIAATAPGSVVHMFSSSRIHGALGDNGQNYKTLAYLASQLGAALSFNPSPSVLRGCGQLTAETPVHHPSLTQANVAATSLPPSVCGPDSPSKVADCGMPDFGSCGNACCFVQATLPVGTAAAYESLRKLLESGIDGHYTYVTGGDPDPTDDLRKYKITKPYAFEFILQGTHSSPTYYGPNSDILNFNLAAASGHSVLRMFSSSRIHGALGDNGQNYKSLAYLAGQLGAKNGWGVKLEIVAGCGKYGLSAATHRVLYL